MLSLNGRKPWKQAAVLLALVFSLLSWAEAETSSDPSPHEINVHTPVYAPSSNYDFPRGTYRYSVTWNSIPAAYATVSIDRTDDLYRLEATAQSAEWLKLLYRLFYKIEGLTGLADFSPREAHIEKQENSKFSQTDISFLPSGEIQSIRRKKGNDPETLLFRSLNFTLDPLSAALFARSLDWEPGLVRKFDVFNGRVRYLIVATCLSVKTVKFNGQPREVWELSPRVFNLTKNKPANKLREVSIFVSTDEKREVLGIESEVFVGRVIVKLEAFHPQGAHHSPDLTARRKDAA